MENSDKVKKEPIVLLGEKLKSGREARGLNIDQVQKGTRIHSRVLLALEEGRCDEILTPTYVKSFLKKYSQFLGLDSNEILKEYCRINREEPRQALTVGPLESKNSFDLARFFYPIFFILVTALLIFLFLWMGKAAVHSLKTRNRVQSKAALQSRDKKANLPKQVPASGKKAARQGEAKKAPFVLVLKMKEPVFIRIRKDGAAPFGRVYFAGLSEPIKVNERAELYVTKGEAIELVLNGRSVGSPGKGIIKSLEVTSEGVKIK